jgi:CO dehydrogenase maturation factor
LSFTIAVSGKGGTGKTTLSGMIIRYLLDKGGGPILAVDADSNSNLNEVLGVEVRSTIGDARELMRKDVPTGMTKDIWFDYKVQESLIEAKGFDLIAMGRPEGAGCYCAANTLARKCLDLLTGNYRYIVIDNEAGMEHFSRLTTRDVDLLFIVSDSSRRGIRTASRIRDLIHELDLRIAREVLVINRVQADLDPETLEEIQGQKLELVGVIPTDEEVYRYDLEGKPTFHLPAESKAVQAARRIFEKYIQ